MYKPIEIDGSMMQDTAQLVEYLNSHGGIIWWGQDGF